MAYLLLNFPTKSMLDMTKSSATHFDLDASQAFVTRAAHQLSILGFVAVILTKALAFQIIDVLASKAKMRRQRRREAAAAKA